MHWYEGGIAEAIQQSHATKSLFCVAILGTDVESVNLLASLESAEVQMLVKEGFVFIRLESNSTEHYQFAQLYPNANGASIYCIANNGAPVEVLSGSLTPNELQGRLGLASQRNREANEIKSSSKSASVSSSNTVVSSDPDPPRSSLPASSSPASAPTHAPSSNTSSSPQDNPEPTAVTETQLPLEERIERAKRLAAAKHQKKLAEEAEEAKRREFERREAGRGTAELKRWQDEQAAKKLIEERRKDKQDEAALRKRIKDQIAQDRIDRQARADREAGLVTETTPNPPPTTTFRHQAQTSANYSGQARLQFRLPDGSTQSSAFDPETTLGAVRQYLLDNSVVPHRNFSIWVAFPRREFTSTDYGTSLRDLGLLPSTALLIIPGPDHSILTNAGNAGEGLMNLVYAFLGYVLLPINFILGFFRPAINPAPGPNENRKAGESRLSARGQQGRVGTGNVLGGGAQQGPSSSSSGQKKESRDGSSSPAEKRAKTTDNSSFGGPDGNVHRLRTSETDSDEEKATWNGNSTQQM